MKGFIHSRVKNQRLPYCAFLFFLAFSQSSTAAEEVRYIASLTTSRSACMVRVNNFPMFDNFDYQSGSISTGFNLTAFVENGNNDIEVLMGSLDPDDSKTLYPNSKCALTITRETMTSSSSVTEIILSVNDRGEIVSSLSSHAHDPAKEAPLDETQFPADQKEKLFRAGRVVKLDGLPEWTWVKATPVTETSLPLIKEAYATLWAAMKAREPQTIRSMATVSSTEMGVAEGISADLLFKSYGLDTKLADPELTPIDLKVDEYALVTYANGRVFRLALGIYQNSPLRLKTANGEAVFSYNPYFAIIDGKVVLVR